MSLAEEIHEQAVQRFIPTERLTVDEYAERHRFLDNAGGGYVGRFRHDMAPYIAQPERELTSLDFLTVAIVGPGQSVKTTAGENWLLRSVGSDPADMLWYMQTDDGIESYVKGRINPMIDQHDELRRNQGLRPIDDSLHFKRFRGMTVEFLSAIHANLINKRAPRIVIDEIDAYDPALGDVKAMIDVRRQTFGMESMVLAMSHPDRALGLRPDRDWSNGIMAIYADSDRRVWYWPCPHCGAWSSPCPIAARVMTLEYPVDGTLDEIEAGTRMLCPVNGCLIEDSHRRAMNIAAWRSPFGGWIGEGQEIAEDGAVSGELVRRKTAGFWIVGLMSLFVIGGIGGLARAMVKAEREREVSGDDETLKQVMVKQFGVPYQPPRLVGSIDANTLADRALGEEGLTLGYVPQGVRFLVAVSDQQIAHFETLVVGWGEKGECWIVDRARIPGDPATSLEDWDQLVGQVIERTYPLADGSERRMGIRAFGYDSGGAPGVTQQAYGAFIRWRRRGLIKNYGKISGREAWSVLPTQGASGINAVRLSVVYPDTTRAASTKVSRGNVPVARFNPNSFKDDLAGQLQGAEPGPWYVHFPPALRSKEPPHLWFEQLCAEHRLPTGRWEKINPSGRNETLDLMVLARVIADLHGLRRINWEKPPSWAAPWDSNSAVKSAAATLVTPAAPKPPGAPGSRASKLAH